MRSVKQVESGVSVASVAESLGRVPSTVFEWMAKYLEGGPAALRSSR